MSLGITTGKKRSKCSMIDLMKSDVEKKVGLTIHIGTERVESRKEPIIHEASVLKQLKTIIEKNKRIIRESNE